MPYYPTIDMEDICKSCYNGSQVTRTKDDCSKSNTTPYCGNCNTDCNTSMSFRSQGIINISQHGDVGSFTGFNATKNAVIKDVWTVEKWNNLQSLYKKANSVGHKQSQNASLSFTPATPNAAITDSLYNEFADAAEAFNTTINSVDKDDIITVALSNALEQGFAKSKFNNNVCDICNAGGEHHCKYNCQCNYNCCNYNCCNHNCGKNVVIPPATT